MGAVFGVLALLASGCQTAEAAPASPRLVLDDCGQELAFTGVPERVVLLETAPVTILDGLGVLDRVVARAGAFPGAYYPSELRSEIAEIPSLSEDIDASGHLVLSQEMVLNTEPDLVLGLPDGVSRELLADAGAEVVTQQHYCRSSDYEAQFSDIGAEVRRFGAVFDRQEAAEDLVASLERRVDDARSRVPDGEIRTAAVLYPSIGGGPLYAYGTGSMAHPQLEAAGFTDVFADVPERVFEVQIEELVERDPDVLILLHQGDADGAEAAVGELPGAESLSAVTTGEVEPLLFNYTEPATPLTVAGLERIVERFHDDD